MYRLEDSSPALRAGEANTVRAELPGSGVEDRQIEDWIVGYLDCKGSRPAGSAWLKANPESSPREPSRSSTSEKPGRDPNGWVRLQVHRKGDIALVRLSDQLLIKEGALNEVAEELEGLVAAGWTRLVVSFGEVERLSSQIVGTLAQVHRRCQAVDGGRLKLCKLRPEAAHVLSLTGLQRVFEVHEEEAAAIEGSWPTLKGPRELPLEVLSELLGRSPQAAEPLETDQPMDQDHCLEKLSLTKKPARLVLKTGKHQGKSLPITESGLVIGRDPSCGLRSDCPMLSRFHARLDRRDGRVFLRDLGSTNGTQVGDHCLRDVEVEIGDGEEFRLGPLRFEVSVDIDPAKTFGTLDEGETTKADSNIEADIPDWLRPEEPPWSDADPEPATELYGFQGETNCEEEAAEGSELVSFEHFRGEIVGGVLVLTPLRSCLDCEDLFDSVRKELQAIAERPLPRKVVLKLSPVMVLPSRAVGILVAWHLNLNRNGGSLRFCEVPPRISAALESMRLTTLIDAFSTVDEAVLTAWP